MLFVLFVNPSARFTQLSRPHYFDNQAVDHWHVAYSTGLSCIALHVDFEDHCYLPTLLWLYEVLYSMVIDNSLDTE